MTRLSLRDRVTVARNVLFRDLEGEAVLLNLASGTYFGLDPVGTSMWRLIVQHGSLARVLEAMLEEYEVEPLMLERDLLELCRRLCANGLGDVISGDS